MEGEREMRTIFWGTGLHQQDCNQLIFSAVFARQKRVLPNSMTYLFWGHSLYKLEISEKTTEKVHKR